LSGGERARVALARLLVVPANFLVMDEPTNHLDLESSERLIEALQGYGGTLLFVSHNRSFINQLAARVWEGRDHGGICHPGNLDDYLHHQAQWAAEAGEPDSAGPGNATKPLTDKDRRREAAFARQKRSEKEGPLKKRVKELELKIAALEQEEKQHEASLAD